MSIRTEIIMNASGDMLTLVVTPATDDFVPSPCRSDVMVMAHVVCNERGLKATGVVGIACDPHGNGDHRCSNHWSAIGVFDVEPLTADNAVL